MIQSQRKSIVGIVILFIFLPLFIVAGIFLINESTKGTYLDLMPAIMGFCMLLFACFLGRLIFSFDKLILENSNLTVYSIFGHKKKEFYLPNITYWLELEKKDKNGSWLELIIYSELGKYKIRSRNYKNYDEIKAEIAKFGYRDIDKEKEITRAGVRRGSIIIMIFGLIIIAIFCYVSLKGKSVVTKKQLEFVGGILGNQLEIIKGSKGARSIEINLVNVPDFTFKISGFAYEATYAEDFVNNVKQGDSILLAIDKGDYQKKITKEKELTFFDRTINYKTIKIVEVQSGNSIYLNLNDYNIAKNDKGKYFFMLLVIGLLLFGLGVYSGFIKKEEQKIS